MVQAFVLCFLLAWSVAGTAGASEKEQRELTAAQVRADAAAAQIDRLEGELASVQRRLRQAELRELAAENGLRRARTQLDAVASTVDAERSEAAGRVTEALHRKQAAEDEWRDTIGALGFLGGLLLVAAAGVAFWLALLTSNAVRYLAELKPSRSATLLIGAGFLGGCVAAAIGAGDTRFALLVSGLLIGVAIAIPTLLGLATRRARRLIADTGSLSGGPFSGAGRKLAVGGGAAVLFLLTIVAASTSTPPAPEAVPAETTALARMGSATDEPTPRLQVLATAVEDQETALGVRSEARQRIEGRIAAKRGALKRVRGQMRRADRSVARWQAALDRPDPQPEPVIAAAPPAEPEEPQEPASPGCDPNYSGCVPPYPPDVNCADIGGSVTVVGSDPHGLDADGDGIGCE